MLSIAWKSVKVSAEDCFRGIRTLPGADNVKLFSNWQRQRGLEGRRKSKICTVRSEESEDIKCLLHLVTRLNGTIKSPLME